MNTRPLRMLSGSDIVAKGRNVTDCILPEVGTKEVASNGSWLESKQVQTALEARKALVAAERVDKVGAMSHAEWSDHLKLAEVTQQVGGHWQYVGRNVNGTFFLLPEETLHMIETNRLLLKHNDVTVSLQKAYSLLLDNEMTLMQYKVYTSLSRLGYKVFRHDAVKEKTTSMQTAVVDTDDNGNSYILKEASLINQQQPNDETKESSVQTSLPSANFSVDGQGVVRMESKEISADIEMNTTSSSNIQTTKSDASTSNVDSIKSCFGLITMANNYVVMQNRIKNRKIQPSDPKNLHDNFKDIPDFSDQQVATVTGPKEELLPRNIFLNNTSYVVKLHYTKINKQHKSTPAPTGNRAMYRTLKNSSESERAAVPDSEIPQFLPHTPPFEQPYGFPNWRPRMQSFQRPFYPQYRFNQHPFFYRVMHHMPQNNHLYRPRVPRISDQDQTPSRHQRTVRDQQLQAIMNFARMMKQIPSPNILTKRSMTGLLMRFNEIYNLNLRITPNFDVIDDNRNVETIEIDDDDVQIKQPLDNSKYDQYFASIKDIAAGLKSLIKKNQPVSKHKRAFNNLLKNFNKTFDTYLYLDSKGELVDKKLVILDSSDSDVVADDVEITATKKRSSTTVDKDATVIKKRKVLPNPFSVLNETDRPSTSQAAVETLNPVEQSSDLSKYFNKNWLRDDDDFGKPAVCSKTDALILHNYKGQQLYDILDSPDKFKNWIDLKLKFCAHMQAVLALEQDLTAHSTNLVPKDTSRLKPILGGIDDDWASSLEKLRIIKTNTDVKETRFKIDFDVYRRDVQNFRKTDPPKPHFRIVCVDESSNFPSGAEVRAIHSKQDDDVTIVFAVVGVGSITYLQINPIDLPVYIGND